MGTGALAAKVGSRLAHVALPMVMPSPAMVASAVGAHVVGPAGMGGAGAAAVGAGIGRAAGASMISLMDMIPVITTGVIATGSPDVMLGPGQIAVLAPSLPQPCVPHLAQPIAMGTPTVTIHGLQLVRVGDKTTCGAFVCDGVKTVIVGGPAAPPAPLSMSDVAGALGGVGRGPIPEKNGAGETGKRVWPGYGQKNRSGHRKSGRGSGQRPRYAGQDARYGRGSGRQSGWCGRSSARQSGRNGGPSRRGDGSDFGWRGFDRAQEIIARGAREGALQGACVFCLCPVCISASVPA